jgi:hypothetical protein
MATVLYEGDWLPSGCHMVLMEIGTDIGGIPTDPELMPPVRVADGGVAILTRCEDSGDVRLEIWLGEPPANSGRWSSVFDGQLETVANGFDAGTATASIYHLDAALGSYRGQAYVSRDVNGEVDGVRSVFPESSTLRGRKLW